MSGDHFSACPLKMTEPIKTGKRCFSANGIDKIVINLVFGKVYTDQCFMFLPISHVIVLF